VYRDFVNAIQAAHKILTNQCFVSIHTGLSADQEYQWKYWAILLPKVASYSWCSAYILGRL